MARIMDMSVGHYHSQPLAQWTMPNDHSELGVLGLNQNLFEFSLSRYPRIERRAAVHYANKNPSLFSYKNKQTLPCKI